MWAVLAEVTLLGLGQVLEMEKVSPLTGGMGLNALGMKQGHLDGTPQHPIQFISVTW